MVDRGSARDVNEAAKSFAETLAESYRVVYGQAAESAERQQQRAREFSELVSSNLREQTEAGRANAQELSEQAVRQQQAGQQLARESVEAYAQFLNDAFSRYQSNTERAAQSAQEGARTLTETTTGLLGTATGTVGGAAGAAAGATVEAVVFPIEGYDEMNVDEISQRLDGLSVEELQLVRDYEELNKKRETLLEQLDRKIRAS
jgi:methylthioribose-1-phosphate isomerase